MQVHVVLLIFFAFALKASTETDAQPRVAGVRIPPVVARLSGQAIGGDIDLAQLQAKGYRAITVPAAVPRERLQAVIKRGADIGMPCLALETRIGGNVASLRDRAGWQLSAAEIGRVCALAASNNVHGIALHCAGSQGLFNPSSEPYRKAPDDVDALALHAEAFGAAVALGMIENPSLDQAYLFIDAVADIDPLWWSWFDGFISALPRNRRISVHLYPVLSPEQSFSNHDAEIARLSAMLRAQLSDASWKWWNDFGDVGISLDRPGTDSARAMTIAKAFSQSNVFVNFPNDSYPNAPAVTTPLDGFDRVGDLDLLGGKWLVFKSAKGAAVLAPFGLRNDVVLRDRTLPVWVCNLDTGVREPREPIDGVVTIQKTDAPLLLDELPVRDWVVPAALQVRWLTPVVEGMTRTPFGFSCTNFTDTTMSGTIAAVPPLRFSVEPDAQQITLGPGDAFRANALLTGSATAGETLPVKIVLGLPGAAPAARDYVVDVLPQLAWQRNFHVPLSIPIARDIDSDGRAELVGVTSDGTLFCFADNAVRWKDKRERPYIACAVGEYWNRDLVVAAVDSENVLHVFDARGSEHWQRPTGTSRAQGLLFANLNPKRGEEIVVGHVDGSITAFYSDSQELWTAQCPKKVARIFTADRDGDGRHDIVALWRDVADHLSLFDTRGNTVWEAALPSPVDAPPITTHGGAFIVVAMRNGACAMVDGRDGTVARTERLGRDPLLGIAANTLADKDGFLVAGSSTLAAIASDFRVIWSIPLACSATPAVAMSPRGLTILQPTVDQGIVALDERGKVLWHDTRAAKPTVTQPLVGDFDGNGIAECVYANDDFHLRAIEMPAR